MVDQRKKGEEEGEGHKPYITIKLTIKMKIIKNSEEKIIFRLKTNETLANSIRRSVGLVPTMAIDEVEISRNDSPLYDETLAHRLGLVPLKLNKTLKEGAVLKFKLDSKKEGKIYSGDIKGDVEVVYDKIPLTLLNQNQEIKLKGKTKIGIGREHSKFYPGILFYRNANEITLGKEFEKEIRSTFPKNEIKPKASKILIKDDQEKPLLDFCEGLAQKNKKPISIEETGEIIFTLESFGQMKAKEILKKTIEILKKNLKLIPKSLK